MTIVDGKPVAPKLLTLDVNLKGVFYCEYCILSCTLIKIDRLTAVHLGVHYVKRNRGPDSWKAIVLTGSVGA